MSEGSDPVITIRHAVAQIEIGRGQALTLWLGNMPQRGSDPGRVQMEVRVMPNGTAEIFCDAPVDVRPFAEWEGMPEKVGTCEGCGLPIFEGELYKSWADGVITHERDCT